MMGDRDYRSVIQNSVESVGRELEYRFNKEDITKIHASEDAKMDMGIWD